MYTEFIAQAAPGKLSKENKILAVILICLLALAFLLIKHSSHLVIAVLPPIALIGYRLVYTIDSKNMIANVKMRFDFHDTYVLWTRDEKEIKIPYDKMTMETETEGKKCEITYTDDTGTHNAVFYGPEDKLEELKERLDSAKNNG